MVEAEDKWPSSHTETARTRISSHSAVAFAVFPLLEVLWKTLFNACSHLRQQESATANRKDAAYLAEKHLKAAACFPPGSTRASAKQGPRDVRS